MIDIGVAGFRVDAAKHIWPEDIGNIYEELHDLNSTYFPSGSRPFWYQEVVDFGGEPITAGEYTPHGRVTEFRYGFNLSQAFYGVNRLSLYKNFGERWDLLPNGTSLAFIDNHDNQRGSGGNIVTYKEPRAYKMAVAFMMAWPYGFTRIMSSYYFNTSDDSPPCDSGGNTTSPTFTPDGTCDPSSGWVCEHRWRQIRNMVAFRNAAAGEPVSNWWDDGIDQIAFGRGNKAFIAINNGNTTLSEILQTGLPAGEYCNVILGDFDPEYGICSGPTITVHEGGAAGEAFFIVKTGDNPVSAIHINARVRNAIESLPS